MPIRLLLGTILALFSLYTGWIIWEFGYTSVFEVSFRQHPSIQVVIDLWIACGLLFFIMILDNQRNGRSLRTVAPYAIITVLAGAIGPLLYFIVYSDLLKSKTKSLF